MKYTLTIILITFITSIWSQDWDTVYTDNKEVDIKVEISYYNCYFVNIDTVYRLTTYTTDLLNRRLLHVKTKKILFERRVSNDTTYCYGYYPSGKMKLYDVSYLNDWLHHSTYYENGKLKSGGDLYRYQLYPLNQYYPDGKIMSKGYYYGYLPHPFGRYEEYYPNGQLACTQNYTLPDTTIEFYQEPELIDEVNYDILGNKIDSNNSVFNIITEYIQPKGKTTKVEMLDSLYTHHFVSSQDGYNNDLKELKDKIRQNLSIPKKCQCSSGIVWFGFIVCKDGSIKNIEIEFPNDCVKSKFLDAIQKIKKWNIATVDSEKVDVYVYTYLILD